MSANEFNKFESDECTSRGLCSISPITASLQELIRYFIYKSAYYVVCLEEMNLYNNKIKCEIINIISSLIYINEYSEQQLYSVVIRTYYIFENSKKRYIKACKDLKLPAKLIKENIKFDIGAGLAQAIKLGAYLTKLKNNTISHDLKNYLELLFLVYKSTSFNISQLSDFNVSIKEYNSKVIKSLCSLHNSDIEHIKQEISDISIMNFKLKEKIAVELIKNFGPISNVKVRRSSRKGKCILVSGSNFFDLKEILEKTKDKGIDVYSHSNLLISHCLDKFRRYKHFYGNYININQNCVADYATFPGGILLTKNSKNNTRYLYRGKIFSHDYVTPQGVIKLKDFDYEPLIDYALKAKGFSKGQKRPVLNLGFNPVEIEKLFSFLANSVRTANLKRVYIIGYSPYQNFSSGYLRTFIKNLNKDEYLISFTDTEGETYGNVKYISIANYSPLFVFFINKYIICTELINAITFIFPICDITTLSLVLSLHSLGIKKIFMPKCSAITVNPVVFKSFLNNYNIFLMTGAEENLKQVRGFD